MEFRIVKAKETDLEQILLLQKECYMTEAEIYNDYNIAPLTQSIESLKNEFEKSILLKALNGNEIVGSVRGFSDGETLYIGKLIVHKNFQNKGIAQNLLDAIEQQCRECVRFELFTGSKSLKNLYLYKKKGYVEFKQQEVGDNMSMIFLEKIKRQ